MDINYELYKVFYYVAKTLSFSDASKRLFISQSAVSQSIKALEKKLNEHFPNVHIKVTNGTSGKCVDFLENGQVDLIVTNYPNPRMNTVGNIRKVKDFKDVFIANRNFEHLKNHPLNFEELLQYPILMLDKSSMTSEFLHNICQQRQLDLVPEVELSSNDLLIDLARIGLGIAFIPDFCLPDNDPDLFKLTMSEVFPSRQLVVGYNDKLPISEAAKYFIESLNEDK